MLNPVILFISKNALIKGKPSVLNLLQATGRKLKAQKNKLVSQIEALPEGRQKHSKQQELRQVKVEIENYLYGAANCS